MSLGGVCSIMFRTVRPLPDHFLSDGVPQRLEGIIYGTIRTPSASRGFCLTVKDIWLRDIYRILSDTYLALGVSDMVFFPICLLHQVNDYRFSGLKG